MGTKRKDNADAEIGVPSLGQCSLWWTEAPQLPGERLGVIGHYQALSREAAAALLTNACDRLRSESCTLAVGPMDGNTWRRYRLITERGAEPPFFMEPGNPPEYPEHFISAGFNVIAGYSSAVTDDLTYADPRMLRVERRLKAAGVTIRPLQLDKFADELRGIYSLSVASFSRNYLYTDISERDFIAQYMPVQPLVVAELVLLAEHEGHVVGYIFALPDPLEAERGTVIVKTVAVLPGRSYAGLGSLLVDMVHQQAYALGYRRAIHALMHDSNNSRNVSGRNATTIRRYSLFARRL